MSYRSFTLEINEKIAHLQFSRAKAYNTMNMDFWQELPAALRTINDEASARVVVISSTGKHFCAGMDLSVFTGGQLLKNTKSEAGRKNENMRRTVLQLQAVINTLEEIRMPVLVAVQGGCIGGALDLIAAADSRYCTEDAFFSIEETKLGMTADIGSLQRLPHIMPHGLVRELAYTGRRLPAEEAKAAGLVNKVFADQEAMLEEVLSIAADIASRSPLAVTGCKEMLNYSRDHSVSDSLNYMATWQSGMFQPQVDMLETFNAKNQKRDPAFEDLCQVNTALD